MVIFPQAKINIGLRIIEKRGDGFHNLQTIFYPVRLSDALEYVVSADESEGDRLVETGYPAGCPPSENIVIKALGKIREKHHIPGLNIHLHKAIPPGSGLGGGSSDAACFIKSLNRYFNIGLDTEGMKEIAAGLGSDCPFFIDGVPSYGEGRGEILTNVKPLDENLFIVLLKPGPEVSTGEAYRSCIPYNGGISLIDSYNKGFSEWAGTMVNDFEKTVFPLYPEIASVKADLYRLGALFSSMSGSGSAVFGIFSEPVRVPDPLKKMVLYSGVL